MCLKKQQQKKQQPNKQKTTDADDPMSLFTSIFNDITEKNIPKTSAVPYFPFQPVVHNWFIKGRGMYCSVYGKVHIKDPLLLIEKSSLCGGSGFPSKKVCQRDHMNDVQ